MEREYYLLEDAAVKAGCTSNDLIHFGAIGKLELCALMQGNPATEHCWDSGPEENEYACEQYEDTPARKNIYGPYKLPRYVIRNIEAGAIGLIHYVYAPNIWPDIWHLDEPVPNSVLRIVVLAEDLKKFSDVPASDAQPEHNSKSPMEKPLGERERASLLVIISALAKELQIDIAMPSKAACRIENMTQVLGARVVARTIENHLKRIPDAMERRANPAD